MTRRALIELCLTLPGICEDYPFADGKNTALRHGARGRWMALIFETADALCVNLKCDPSEADFLRSVHPSILPAWHMNKTHWNTVVLNREVSEEELWALVRESYDLTKPKGAL